MEELDLGQPGLDELVESATMIVKNPIVFEEKYVPKIIYIRKQIKQVGMAIASFIKHKIPTNLILVGPSGSGKTLAALYYKKELEEKFPDFEMRYISCREYDTTYKILTKLVGKSLNSTAELFRRFVKSMDKNVILVLDEADPLVNDKRLIYLFSRMSLLEEDVDYRVMLILISNNIRFASMLEETDPTAYSSLHPNIVLFDAYNVDEIKKILISRARDGLVDGTYDEGILDFIAALTVGEGLSNARLAIRTLYHAASMAEHNGKSRIPSELIRPAFEIAKKDIEIEGLRRLDDLALLILVSSIMSRNKTAKSIYDFYKKLTNTLKSNLDDVYVPSPVSYPYFHKCLSHLQVLGFVMIAHEKGGGPRRAVIYPILLDDATYVYEEFKRRFKVDVRELF